MYLPHFGLTELPFRITPHTEFFYSGASRGAILDGLLYAVTHDEGIVKVSGEVGSGKTMLCRALMERLPKSVTIVYLANPSLSRDDILYAIADELNLKLEEGMRSSAVIRTLQEHLLHIRAEGRRVVVLVDEANAMPVETLEEIRLLSNLESEGHKLLQLVLFGQPEINQILARTDMRQLKERITHNFLLEPLLRDDVAEYLEFRMRAAGYRGPNVFSPQATRLISEASLGLTRRINILADKALAAAFNDKTRQITAKHVRVAIRESEFSATSQIGRTVPELARPLLAAALATVLAAASYLFLKPEARDTSPLPSVPPAAAETAPVAEAAVPPAALPAEAQAPSPAAPVGEPNTPPVAAPTASGNAPTLLDAALASGQQWIKEAPSGRWFLQLYSVDASQTAQVENFLREARDAGLDLGQTRAYKSDLSGRMRYGIIYGDYDSLAQSHQAAAALPQSLRERHPFPRPVKQLR